MDLNGNGILGDSKMANKNVENNYEKRNFLERMKEREKRQKKKVKISPSVQSAQAEFRKKPSFKGRSPIDNLKTSPAVKNFIKEKFDKEKVKYSFLPERQVQLQMIQRYKIEIENGKKELPIKEKSRRPLKVSMLNESENKFSPGRKSTRVIDCPPYFAPKLTPCGDRKLVKSVRFQSDYHPNEVKPKMMTSKPPFKSILKVANKGEDNPAKSQTLRIKIIPDSHSPHIKNLDQYLNELENRNYKVDFGKEMNTAARKMVADNAKASKFTDSPARRVPPVRTKLLFTSPKEEGKNYDIKSTPNSDEAPVDVDKLLVQSKSDSNELPVNVKCSYPLVNSVLGPYTTDQECLSVNSVLEPSLADGEYPLVNSEPFMADKECPLVNSDIEPFMADKECLLVNSVLDPSMADGEYPLVKSDLEPFVADKDMCVKSRIVKVAIVLDSHTNPIKALEVYRDHLERGDQETRFEKLINTINQGKLDNDFNDDFTNLRKVDDGINDELTGNVFEGIHKYTILTSKKNESKGDHTPMDILDHNKMQSCTSKSSEIQQDKAWYSQTEETFNRYRSIIEPPTENYSMKEGQESNQLNLKYGRIFYDEHESSTDVEHEPSVLPFKKQHENSSSDLNSEGFFSEDVDMENYTNSSGVSIGINFRKNDGDTSNSLLQTPQQVFDDEEIMYNQHQVGVPIEKNETMSPELMCSPQRLKASIPQNIINCSEEISGYNTGRSLCDLFSEVEEADSAMESTENLEEMENDENCKIS